MLDSVDTRCLLPSACVASGVRESLSHTDEDSNDVAEPSVGHVSLDTLPPDKPATPKQRTNSILVSTLSRTRFFICKAAFCIIQLLLLDVKLLLTSL